METRDFVRACKAERDTMLSLYGDVNSSTKVGELLKAANLDSSQRSQVLAAIDVVLTDAFYTVLIGLAGSGSIGGTQQTYHLQDESGGTLSPSGSEDLETLAYECFQSPL